MDNGTIYISLGYSIIIGQIRSILVKFQIDVVLVRLFCRCFRHFPQIYYRIHSISSQYPQTTSSDMQKVLGLDRPKISVIIALIKKKMLITIIIFVNTIWEFFFHDILFSFITYYFLGIPISAIGNDEFSKLFIVNMFM